MTRARCLLAAAVLAAPGAAVWHAVPAQALSCVQPGHVVAEASHVFAGTIAGGDGELLVVDVVEVWSGGPVLEQVLLPLEAGMGIWYPWEVGSPPVDPEHVWVVATGDDFVVGACGIWPQQQVENLRPQRTSPPVRGTAEQVTVPTATVAEPARAHVRGSSRLATAAVVGGVSLAGGWWLTRRRRGRQRVKPGRTGASSADLRRLSRLSRGGPPRG